MRPTDVLLHRRVMHEWTAEKLRHFDQTIGLLPGADTDKAEPLRELWEHLHFAAGNGEVYWVNADMTAVAKAAAHSMPAQVLRTDDLPSRAGYLLYDEPIAETLARTEEITARTIVGFTWSLSDVHPHWGSDPGAAGVDDPPTGHVQWVDIQPLSPFEIVGFPKFLPNTAVEHGMRWYIGGEPVNDEHNVAASLLATWTLMQQSLTMSERASGDRAERRRSARAGLPADVLIVRLRRRQLDGDQDQADEEGVAWSHRWLVSGHWRNQWLPSRTAHRLQWIAGYVKGPASKPLVVKDRMTAWVR